MIVCIRGTSGSGKSHLVREVAKRVGPGTPHYVEGRRRPLFTTHDGGRRRLSILGHYETACGGCDTIPSYDETFALVRERHELGDDVLFEGLLLTPEFSRTAALVKDGFPLVLLFLDVPIELALESVNARRRAKDPGKADVNPANTVSKHKQAKRAAERLREAGADVRILGRSEALRSALGLFGLEGWEAPAEPTAEPLRGGSGPSGTPSQAALFPPEDVA